MSWKLHGKLECLNTHILPLSITARIHQHSPLQISALDPHNCWVNWKLWFSDDPQHQARLSYRILLVQKKKDQNSKQRFYQTCIISYHHGVRKMPVEPGTDCVHLRWKQRHAQKPYFTNCLASLSTVMLTCKISHFTPMELPTVRILLYLLTYLLKYIPSMHSSNYSSMAHFQIICKS